MFVCVFHLNIYACVNTSTMAGLHSSLRPTSSSSRLLLLLTLLPLSLAALAFVLQWRGGYDDPVTRWPGLMDDHHDRDMFPGMDKSAPIRTTSINCADVLSQKRTPTFPYLRGWNFEYGSDLQPKVRSYCYLLIFFSFGFLI